MTVLHQKLRHSALSERGATAVEFGMAVGLVATLLVVGGSSIGHALAAVFDAVSAAF